jgi:hypothetical protein
VVADLDNQVRGRGFYVDWFSIKIRCRNDVKSRGVFSKKVVNRLKKIAILPFNRCL